MRNKKARWFNRQATIPSCCNLKIERVIVNTIESFKYVKEKYSWRTIQNVGFVQTNRYPEMKLG